MGCFQVGSVAYGISRYERAAKFMRGRKGDVSLKETYSGWQW
jgi:hypothetical protein